MNYPNSNQSYFRTATKIGARPQIGRKRALLIFGGAIPWLAIGKTVLVVLPVTLVVNILISSAVSNLDQSISVLQSRQQQIEDRNIDLLAQKARVWAPDNIEKLAGEKLSLYSPSEGQVGKFDRNTYTFKYL